jgi:hypothetical protein
MKHFVIIGTINGKNQLKIISIIKQLVNIIKNNFQH